MLHLIAEVGDEHQQLVLFHWNTDEYRINWANAGDYGTCADNSFNTSTSISKLHGV